MNSHTSGLDFLYLNELVWMIARHETYNDPSKERKSLPRMYVHSWVKHRYRTNGFSPFLMIEKGSLYRFKSMYFQMFLKR
jgi:hypothetical protein